MRIQLRHLVPAAGLTLILGIAGCDHSPAGPTTPVSVTLAPDQSILVEQTRLRFVRLVSDDRCPLNAVCVQQGDATIEIDLTVEGQRTTHELSVNDRNLNSVTSRGVVVTLGSVDPYPIGGTPTDPGDYRATFEIASE